MAADSPRGYRAVFGAKLEFHVGLVALGAGACADVVQACLCRIVGDAGAGGAAFMPPDPPVAFGLVREVRVLPIAFGVFLLLLALAGVWGTPSRPPPVGECSTGILLRRER